MMTLKLKKHILLLALSMPLVAFSQSLQAELDSMSNNFTKKADPKRIEIYEAGIDSVRQSGILDSAVQTGQKAPDFTLVNAAGQKVTLSQQLKKGPVVLVWYRGGWCPYCNKTLSTLQEYLPEFTKRGATLIAITPEVPDSSLSTKERKHLEFEILSDVGNKVGQQYHVVFTLATEVGKMYKAGGWLEKYNGDSTNTLPLAATYVIDKNGMVTYSFLDADYRKRAEPEAIIGALDRIKK
jgi:peroxiredoxin